MKEPKAKGVKCKLIGRDGNVFNIIAVVVRELNKAGYKEMAKEYQAACFRATSYDEVLRITMEHIEVE
jgi:hypothetical protein